MSTKNIRNYVRMQNSYIEDAPFEERYAVVLPWLLSGLPGSGNNEDHPPWRIEHLHLCQSQKSAWTRLQRCYVGKGRSNPVPEVWSHRKWTVRFLRQTQVQSRLSGVLPEAAPQARPEMGICLSTLLQLRSRQMHFRRNRCGPVQQVPGIPA